MYASVTKATERTGLTLSARTWSRGRLSMVVAGRAS
jgi:hypothetical protein